MEVKKPAVFILYTVALVASLIAIIIVFSKHPMGSDFTTYKEISASEINNLSQQTLKNSRIAIRGKVTIDKPEDLIKIGEHKDVVAVIFKVKDPNAPKNAKVTYESWETKDFSIDAGGTTIPVRGQPELINDPGSIIPWKNDPGKYFETVRNNKEYTIFGDIGVVQGKAMIKPYYITSESIAEVKSQAEQVNKRMFSMQYLLVFSIVAIYIILVWKSGIIGRESEDTIKENPAVQDDAGNTDNTDTKEE